MKREVEIVDKESLGGPLIIAALMLGVSILGASYFLSQSLQRGSEGLSQLAAAVGEIKSAGAGQVAAAPPKRNNRPDPDKRYKVALGGSPGLGSAKAAINVVEWSDFQ
jgi:protein-disulfide isomerase